MFELLDISQQLVSEVPLRFKRYLANTIDWENRLIGIKGARGTGKTTLLLQYLKNLNISDTQKAYFSLDNMYFLSNSLTETARKFYQQGGKVLVLDEVHKYPLWSREIKNLYDNYRDLKIIFTGSSIIDISKQEVDLSRRALMYELHGLSYREFLEYEHEIKLDKITLNQIIERSGLIKDLIPENIRAYEYFNQYLTYGYYPFYREDVKNYHKRLMQLIRLIVEYDMSELKGFDSRNARKMLQLLQIIAEQVPFKPNLVKLSGKTDIHRNTIANYLYFLEKAKLINLLYSSGPSISSLQKPDKIFLNNTNLMKAMAVENPNTGMLRETFFLNQLLVGHEVNQSKQADFIVNKKYTFEIGGHNKQSSQIAGIDNAFVVKDNIENPAGNALPLWLFGFLY